MHAQLNEEFDGKLLIVWVSGKLTYEDYLLFLPRIERLIGKHGKMRILFDMQDFHGWEASALWEDLKFDVKHFGDIERLALVGEKPWERWMANFCRPFTMAEVRYFDRADSSAAYEWIREGLQAMTSEHQATS